MRTYIPKQKPNMDAFRARLAGLDVAQAIQIFDGEFKPNNRWFYQYSVEAGIRLSVRRIDGSLFVLRTK